MYLCCTQMDAKVTSRIALEKQEFFTTLISTVTDIKTTYTSKESMKAWSYDLQRHAQKCDERVCELAQSWVDQLLKVSTP